MNTILKHHGPVNTIEFSVAIAPEAVRIVNCVVRNRKCCKIRDDLGKIT